MLFLDYYGIIWAFQRGKGPREEDAKTKTKNEMKKTMNTKKNRKTDDKAMREFLARKHGIKAEAIEDQGKGFAYEINGLCAYCPKRLVLRDMIVEAGRLALGVGEAECRDAFAR